MAKLRLVGTTTIFFAVVNALKIGPYFALGQFSMGNFATSVALLPLAVVTNFIGIWLVRVTPTELFYKIAYILVLVVSLVLIWQGLSSKSVGASRRLICGALLANLGHRTDGLANSLALEMREF